jgi:hypothetical protein
MAVDEHGSGFDLAEERGGRRQRGTFGSGVARASSPLPSAGTPSWSSIAAVVLGMKGCSTVAKTRSAVCRCRSTTAMRTGSVFFSAQGA